LKLTLQNARLYKFLADDPLASEAAAVALADLARDSFDVLRSRAPKDAGLVHLRWRFNRELKTAASFCLLTLPPELAETPEE